MQQEKELVKEGFIPDYYNEIDVYGDPETSLLRNLVNFRLYNDAGQSIKFSDLGEGKSLGTLVGEVVEPLPVAAKQRIMERSCSVRQLGAPAHTHTAPAKPSSAREWPELIPAGSAAEPGESKSKSKSKNGSKPASRPTPPQPSPADANANMSAWFETEKIYEEVIPLLIYTPSAELIVDYY
jgi:hypothetical protein